MATVSAYNSEDILDDLLARIGQDAVFDMILLARNVAELALRMQKVHFNMKTESHPSPLQMDMFIDVTASMMKYLVALGPEKVGDSIASQITCECFKVSKSMLRITEVISPSEIRQA